MSLAALKKQSDFSSLIDEYNKQTTPQETKSFADDRIWKPELDKSGNGYAVIRFLPAPNGEEDALGIILRPRFSRARWMVY